MNTKHIAKKFFSVFVVFATILWTFSPVFLLVNKAQAAASIAVQIDTAGMGGVMFEIPWNGLILPASSSQPAGLFSFMIKKTSAATLTSVKVNLVGTAEASDIASISLYKRTDFSSGGMGYAFPAGDKIGELLTGGLTAFADSISANNIIPVTQTDPKNAIGTDFYSAQYFVAISTSAGWAGTDNVSYNLSADWITVSDGTLGSACASNPQDGKNYCQPVTDKYYASTDGGYTGMSFAIENVESMGVMGDGTKEVNVRFTSELDTTSALTAANYAIAGTAPTSVKMMTPRSVSLTFASSVTITPNQTALIIKGPTGVNNGVKNTIGSVLNADVNMMIMGGGGPGGAPLLISEVMIGTATDPLKEFVEIYNSSPNAVNFANMPIKLWVTSYSGTTVAHTKITDITTGTIAPNGYFLIASSQYDDISPTADKTYDASLGGAEGRLQANRGIYISTSDSQNIGIIDKLGWGTATPDMSQGMPKCSSSDPAACTVGNDGKSLERKANPQATAATMSTSGSDAGNGNSYMSMNNQYDFIQRTTAQPQSTASATESPGGAGFGLQNTPPNIYHQPLFMGLTGSDLIIMSDIGDDSGELSASNTKLFYRYNNPAGAWQEITGVKMGPGNFKFTIPSAGLDATKDLDYYLRATDGTKYACMPVNCNVDTGVLGTGTANYIDIQTISATNNVISGFVRDTAGVGINGVMVFLDGSPYTTTTNSSGAWTLSGMMDGIYRVRASGGSYTTSGVTQNYTDGWLEGISVNSNNTSSTNNTIVLTQGMGGQGGDREMPMVMWSAPNDQMMGAPTRIDIKGLNQIEAPIMLGFSKTMDATTINTTNIKLKSVSAAGVLTEVSGTCVIYQVQGAEAILGSSTCARTGVTSVNFGPDRKAVIYSATPLTPNTPYIIELTGAVKDNAGNPLQGARPGGGHVISFTTSAGDFGGMSGGTATNTTFIDKFGATQQFGTSQAQVTNFASGGNMMPPYVMATIPSPGARNVLKDTNIVITFSEPMDPSSINAGTVILNKIGVGDVVFSSTALTLDNTKAVVTLTLPAVLSSNQRYAIKVMGGVKSAKGIYITKPDTGYENRVMYQTDFEVGSSSDTARPTVQGTNLQMYQSGSSITGVPNSIGVIDIGFSKDMDPATINTSTITLKSGTNNVSATITYDMASRSARVMPSSVLYTNTQYTLTVVSGASGAKSINGAAGTYNQIAADYTQNFTTSSAIDTQAPRVDFANGDDYRLAITFSEGMKAPTAVDTNNWANSVLNPANYILYADNNPPPSGSTALYFGKANLSQVIDSATGGPLSFKYDAPSHTVSIEGLRMRDTTMTVQGGFRVFVRNVKDLSGNIITANGTVTSASWTPTLTSGVPNTFNENAAGGGIMNSQTSFGMIGPGGGGMMGPPPTAMMEGGFAAGKGLDANGMNQAQDFGGKNVFDMGFQPIGVWPMNMQAGATSMYMIDIPISQALSAGDKIILTFPQGFNVAGAKSGDPNNKFAHQDINGPGPGTVRLKTSGITEDSASATQGGLVNDGVVINTQARTVTLYLNITGATTTGANDFLHFEIDGIVNGQIAKDFNTSGYSVDIKTQSGTRVLESKTSMPFFLQPKGNITLNVTVNFKNTAGAAANVTKSDVKVYLMSPMAGPLKQTANFANASSAVYAFSNLNAGMYHLMTEPMVSAGTPSVDYYSDRGDPRPFDIAASNTNCTNSTCTATINLQAENATNSPQVTVYLMGTFATDDIDIFAGGPGGFRVKTVEDVDGVCDNTNVCSYTLSLPGTGKFMVGMGPAMPKGPEMMGPPPMPTWMPPQPKDVQVSGSAGNWTFLDPLGSATGDIVNDGKITISISSADKTITGYVCKTVNTGNTACAADQHVSNAEIFANSPMGGFGAHVTSNSSDGSFTLRVREGFYKVGAFLPGMPPSGERSVDVRGSSMYVDGSSVASTKVILKVKVPDYNISGKVTDGTNVVKGAGVYAYRTDGPGKADSMTDSTGKYILYVNPGTWKVGAFIPGFGQLPSASELSVTISTESATNQNINPPTTTTYVSVKGQIYKDDGSNTPLAGVHVIAEGTNYVNDAMTDSSGIYTLSVPSGQTYDIKAWSPSVGKLPMVDDLSVTGAISAGGAADIVVPNIKTVTINFVNASSTPVVLTEAFVQLDKVGVKEVGNDVRVSGKSSIALEVPIDATCNTTTGANCYALDIDIPGISETAFALDKISGAVGTTVTGMNIDNASSTKEMYTVKVDDDEIINIIIPDLYTISGTIKDESDNAVSDAIVHIERPGTEVEFDVQADSDGVYSLVVPAGNYLVQADKVGYMDTASTLTVSADNAAANLTVAAGTTTIAGTVQIGSTGVDKATVIIEQLGGGFTTVQSNTDGTYAAQVPAGDYKVSATAEGYTQKYYLSGTQAAIVSTTGGNATAKNVTLSTTATGLDTPPTALVTPQNGGSIEHGSTTGVGIDLPPGALGQSSTGYNVIDKDSSNIPLSTPTASIIGGEAKNITSTYPTSSGGQVPKQDLDADMGIEMSYTKAQLVADGIDTFAEIENIKASYYNDTARNWASLPTNITYLGSSSQTVIPDATLSNVSAVIIAGKTDHLTVFGATNPSPDGLAPKTATSVSATGSTSSITITWTAPTQNADNTTLTDLLGYEIYRSTSASGTYVQLNTTDILTATYTDSTAAAGTTYYYKVTAADTGGIESVMSSVSSGVQLTVTTPGGGVPIVQTEPEITTPEPTEPETTPEKPVAEMTIAEIKAKILEITALIAELQKQLLESTGAVKFTKPIKYNQRNDEVKKLQEALIGQGLMKAGLNTGWFGPLTKAAVIKFQVSKNLVGDGIVGPKTRAELNKL